MEESSNRSGVNEKDPSPLRIPPEFLLPRSPKPMTDAENGTVRMLIVAAKIVSIYTRNGR